MVEHRPSVDFSENVLKKKGKETIQYFSFTETQLLKYYRTKKV